MGRWKPVVNEDDPESAVTVLVPDSSIGTMNNQFRFLVFGNFMEILAKNYTKITVMTEDEKTEIARITNYEIIPASGYVVKLTPSYD